MEIGVKTSGRMFSDVVQVQLNTNLYIQFIALQTANVIIPSIQPKLTGVF